MLKSIGLSLGLLVLTAAGAASASTALWRAANADRAPTACDCTGAKRASGCKCSGCGEGKCHCQGKCDCGAGCKCGHDQKRSPHGTAG